MSPVPCVHTGRRVMLVPTMGALHDGHLALVRSAKRVPGSVVVVSIFVNPLQFGAERISTGTRSPWMPTSMLREEGVEVVFAPTAAAMYPHGPRTWFIRARWGGTRRRLAANAFRRHANRCAQAAADRRPGSCVLRREGLPAARTDQADGGGPRRRRPYRRCADSARGRRTGDVVAQPVPQRGRTGAGQRVVVGAARRNVRAPRGSTRRWMPPARCSTRCPPSTSTIWRCATRCWGRCPRGLARMLVAGRLGQTRLLDNIAIDIGPPPGAVRTSSTANTNYLGGTDVTHDAEIQDSPATVTQADLHYVGR